MSKVMVVEDDASLREIYSIRITAEGYDVVSASDGEEALAVAVREKPDLILSDVMMPKISGFDMLDILRSTPETAKIKVIMMTALSAEDQRQRGERLGADRYLVKSQVGIEDVVNAIHEVLGDKATATPTPSPTPAAAAPAPATSTTTTASPQLSPSSDFVAEQAAATAQVKAATAEVQDATPGLEVNPIANPSPTEPAPVAPETPAATLEATPASETSATSDPDSDPATESAYADLAAAAAQLTSAAENAQSAEATESDASAQ